MTYMDNSEMETPAQAEQVLTKKQQEQERQHCEFRWENNKRVIKQKLATLDLSAYTLTNLHKELNDIFNSYGSVKKHDIVDKNTSVQLINGVDYTNSTLGELMSFISKRSNTVKYQDKGLDFNTLVICQFNQNPFLHPLAKSLNVMPMDDDWLENHSFISVEAYDKLNKGESFDGKGFWNTTAEDALNNIDKFQRTKKYFYDGDKVQIINLYAKDYMPVKEAII